MELKVHLLVLLLLRLLLLLLLLLLSPATIACGHARHQVLLHVLALQQLHQCKAAQQAVQLVPSVVGVTSRHTLQFMLGISAIILQYRCLLGSDA